MGKPFGKASACLREAASAKAGANLLSNLHSRPPSYWSSLDVLSSDTLKIQNDRLPKP